MNRIITHICISLLLLVSQRSIAQELLIKGIVMDAGTFKPLSNTSLILDKKQRTMTDSLGIFEFKASPGKHRIMISRVGYRNQELNFDEVLAGKREFQVQLEPYANQLNQVVIAGSRNATILAREVSSVNIIQPYLISNSNANDLSDVLNKVPGISVVDGQPTFRGGVGYSYNTGSRVAVLLDDMPLLGADLGDVRWNFMPIEAAEQIEVIKGSSSVLYGSSALNGTVNVRTGWGTQKPSTKITFYEGVYSDPIRKETKWWGPTTSPFTSGAFFSHKQSFGKFDLVWSGNVNASKSHLQGADAFRGRTYIKTRYRFNKRLSAGMNMNLMYEKSGRFFLWQDADSGALKPFENYTTEDFYRIISFDPHLDYVTDKSAHALKFRLYQIHRYSTLGKHNPGDNDAIANLYAMDYNYKTRFNKHFNMTAGTYLTSLWAIGNVYAGTFAGFSAAAYAQGEYHLERLTVLAGARYELNGLDTVITPTGLLKRLGLNYMINSSTFIRANYSEGFRVPTIGEKFVQDNVSSINVLPNHALHAEKGWTAELGIQKGLHIGNFFATLDFALFDQEYDSMIEFKFGQWVPAVEKPPIGVIGFKAFNIGQTRTAGYEFSVSGEGRIGGVQIRTLAGYTYSMPMNLTAESQYTNWNNYMTAFMSSMGKLDSSKYYNAMMPYRNRKLAKVDIEGTYRKVSIGYSMQYYSVYEKADEFTYLLPGASEFFKRAGSGDYVHGIRASLMVSPTARIAFLVNNVANREYATRPGKIDPPRNFNIQLRVVF